MSPLLSVTFHLGPLPQTALFLSPALLLALQWAMVLSSHSSLRAYTALTSSSGCHKSRIMWSWLSHFAEELGNSWESDNTDLSGTNTSGHEVCCSCSITGDHLQNISLLRPRSCFWGPCPHRCPSLLFPFLSFLIYALGSSPCPVYS